MAEREITPLGMSEVQEVVETPVLDRMFGAVV